ncbi:CD151 antigen-like [Ornithodoros turicata]|uniref:CD151 antigen-like n=1 Tax=Ornithodoros turicata TaxID=34597 RepID=UPI0031393C7E
MALTCGAKCAKALLITFNFIFWLSGLALIGLGAFLLIDEHRSTLFRLFRVDGNYALLQYLACALVGTGLLVLLIGFLGCCGAIKENRCLLGSYFFFLFLILGCELAIGIFALLFQDKITTEMKQDLHNALIDDYGKTTHVTTAFDWAQTKLQCCGVSGPHDYAESAWKRENLGKGDTVSKTCCRLRDETDPDAHKNPRPLNETLCQDMAMMQNAYRHQRGCLDALKEFIRQESTLLIAVGCGVAGLEIIGMIFAICLCKEVQ